MAKATGRRASRRRWIWGWLVLLLLIVVSNIRGWTGNSESARSSLLAVREEVLPHEAAAVQRPERFRVTIRRPSGPPSIELQPSDALGRVGRVTCSTCHSIREPNLETRKPSDLNEFHQDMTMAHGELGCYSCHNPDDSDTLRRADGRVVEYTDVMDLCAQCHGSQAKDYARGFHGGMTGYWDLSRGGRVRNNCIDCHDPHAPQFPMMQPTFKPHDRFLTPHAPDGPSQHEATH